MSRRTASKRKADEEVADDANNGQPKAKAGRTNGGGKTDSPAPSSSSSSSHGHGHEEVKAQTPLDDDSTARAAALMTKYPNLQVLPASKFLRMVHTILRNSKTSRRDFVYWAEHLTRMVCEAVVDTLPMREKVVTTPTDDQFRGVEPTIGIMGVSILRAGSSMENGLRSVFREAKIGKLLIQRDETKPDKPARLHYSKLPKDVADHHIILMDPMLATGNSVLVAIQELGQVGVRPENITFANLVSCVEGIETLAKAYPAVKIVTTMVDPALNANKYIMPGVGDFGDRYFGTE